MEWYVYYYNFNQRRIESYNIFDHYRFRKDVEGSLHECKTREEFAKALRSHLFYYFNSKCEWEVLISPWVGNKEEGKIKVDVYDQVMLNWDIFLEYVWTH